MGKQEQESNENRTCFFSASQAILHIVEDIDRVGVSPGGQSTKSQDQSEGSKSPRPLSSHHTNPHELPTYSPHEKDDADNLHDVSSFASLSLRFK